MKPDNVTFAQAASAPVAAFTAFQGLRDKGQTQPGQKVLISRAAEGVGTFAVQIAKSFGAEVTLFFDCIGNHSLSACRRVLNPRGTYIGVGGPGSRWMIGLLARPTKILELSQFVS
jgi:NADPH:quinone reductase-like Zn-dependent oxidoreductase